MMADHPSEQVDRVAAALMNAATGQRTWTYTSLDQYRVLARAALDAATPPACPDCDGDGTTTGAYMDCHRCQGTGRVGSVGERDQP
jgi:DnaJ-class molecular chaperone